MTRDIEDRLLAFENLLVSEEAELLRDAVSTIDALRSERAAITKDFNDVSMELRNAKERIAALEKELEEAKKRRS